MGPGWGGRCRRAPLRSRRALPLLRRGRFGPWRPRRSLRSRHTGRFFDATRRRLRGAGLGWPMWARSPSQSPAFAAPSSQPLRGGASRDPDFAAPRPLLSLRVARTSPPHDRGSGGAGLGWQMWARSPSQSPGSAAPRPLRGGASRAPDFAAPRPPRPLRSRHMARFFDAAVRRLRGAGLGWRMWARSPSQSRGSAAPSSRPLRGHVSCPMRSGSAPQTVLGAALGAEAPRSSLGSRSSLGWC